MATDAKSIVMASKARRAFVDGLIQGLSTVLQSVDTRARTMLTQVADPALVQRRRQAVEDLTRHGTLWVHGLQGLLRGAQSNGLLELTRPGMLDSGRGGGGGLSLVDDSTIEGEIISSRLSLAIMDRASWEFNDLRSRITVLEDRDELDQTDIFRPHVIARAVTTSWGSAGLSHDIWRVLQGVLHEEFAHFIEEGFHEVNRSLISQGVRPEIDLRPFIRRAHDTGGGSAPAAVNDGSGHAGGDNFDPRRTGVFVPNRTTTFDPNRTNLFSQGGGAGRGGGAGGGGGVGSGHGASGAGGGAGSGSGAAGSDSFDPRRTGVYVPNRATQFSPNRTTTFEPNRTTTFEPNRTTTFEANRTTTFEANRTNTFQPTGAAARSGRVHDETRMQTRSSPLVRGESQAEAVLGRLNRLIARQLPEFAATSVANPQASPGLNAAIGQAQTGIARRFSVDGKLGADAAQISMPAVLEEMHQRKQMLKQAATTPVERATIEIVALLFQSLLTEERLPASVRVWFARLQMPVLRVAVSEPDFFAAADHPARRLIDRMGACVMGFDATLSKAGELLEREIKRVVQVVEAYPDTGRRVFQTVLNEFEKFLENFFKNENETTKKGVSLAQQVEQRETLAIQYTIELRKMLSEVPVQDGVREFLFHVWADVMAITALKQGVQSEATKTMRQAAHDLVWSASAKVSREERASVIRRLPPLLKLLRDGMHSAGLPQARQDESIQKLNNSLAAAFTARAATISPERMAELKLRLETLEELLPDSDEVEIDESMVLDLSGHESSELEVVGEGGSMPTEAMLELAKEQQVGTWYTLDYRNRVESVQLAWQGMRRQLSLFVSQQGRGILFQQNRLAAFLQAGLLLPVQDEALTVRATRSAMAKIDADPQRLQN